jgi:hypothetical protein
MGVDRRVDECEAKPWPPALAVSETAGQAVHLPTPTWRDLGLFLDVDMDQLARVAGFNPAHDASATTLEVRQARHPMAGPDRVKGRCGNPGALAETGRADLVTSTQLDDPALRFCWGLGRTASGAARAVLEGWSAPRLVATPPLMGGLARDPHRLSSRSDRPAVFDQTAQAESTLRGKRSVTVHGEPPWLCGCVNSSTLPWGLTSSGDCPRQQGP